MGKLWAIAVTEYRQVVFTKTFIISLLFPIVIYGGIFVAMALFGDKVDTRDRVVEIIDQTGELYADLEAAAAERNRSTAVVKEGKAIAPRYVLQAGLATATDAEALLALSERVRAGEIFAFLLIGEDFLGVEGGNGDYLRYYSDAPTFTRLPDWLERQLREAVETRRYLAAGLDPRTMRSLSSHNQLESFKLVEVSADGEIRQPEAVNRIAATLIPFGLVMLVMVSIQMTTPILLNSVIEEKMRRVAEVLIASVSPLQLLAGKLFAGVSVGLTFSAVYMASMAFSLRYFEKMSWVSAGTYLWFFVFLVVGMLAFGALFAGVSSACQDLKDTQNLATPVMLLLIVPMMLSFIVLEAPDGTFAKTLSYLPPFSIMTMLARIAIPPGPQTWEILVALAGNIAFAIVAIWAASRIFRIGILSQGKAPGWGELARWLLRRD